MRDVNVTGTNYYAVCSQGEASVNIESGTFDKVSADGYSSKALLWLEASGSGTYDGVYEEWNASIMDIEGGTFTVLEDQLINTNGAHPTITGGTFINEASEKVDISAYLADTCKQNDNGTYGG